VRLNSLAEPDVVHQFDRAVRDFAGVRGLVLDLRHLTEGKSRYGYGILARLVARPFVTVRWRTPEHRAVFRVWRLPDSASSWFAAGPDTIAPRSEVAAYAGPVAVLSSAGTAGPGEDLLITFRNTGRGVIVGDSSAGSAGEALTVALVKNWSTQFCATRDGFPDGTEIAGSGLAPEVAVSESVADFLAGRDLALERARAYLTTQPR
jgi:C-terminal processing protease CtpA/Prc